MPCDRPSRTWPSSSLGFLDATDGEHEEENEHGDGGADDEPSLGASDAMNQEWAWSSAQNPTRDDCEEQNEDGDDLDTLEVDEVELKGEADGDNGGCVDDEPSLGSLDGRFSQLRSWVLWPSVVSVSMKPLPQARGSDANGCLKGLFLLLGVGPSIHALWEAENLRALVRAGATLDS
jgi:hypothetical protein